MKYLILTEGTDEKALFDLLLSRGLLKFKKDDLLFNEIHHGRQLKYMPKQVTAIQMLPNQEKVKIIRIGDKLNDVFQIPKDLRMKIDSSCEDYHTTPEFEILLIINENQYPKYLKTKRS